MQERKLSSFASLQSGQVLSRKEAQPGEHGKKCRRLTLRAIGAEGTVDRKETEFFLTKEAIRPDQLTCENDIVIRMFNPIYPALITSEDVGLFVPAQLGTIRVEEKTVVLPAYLRWYLSQPKVAELLLAMSGGITQRAIKIAALAELMVPIPPIERQKTIIKIDELGKRCARLHTELGNQQRILSEAITNRMIGGQ